MFGIARDAQTLVEEHTESKLRGGITLLSRLPKPAGRRPGISLHTFAIQQHASDRCLRRRVARLRGTQHKRRSGNWISFNPSASEHQQTEIISSLRHVL